MATVRFYTILRSDLGTNQIEIELSKPVSLSQLLALAEERLGKPFKNKLLNGTELANRTIILVNGKNVHHIGKLNTIIKNTDEIDIFPPGGGG